MVGSRIVKVASKSYITDQENTMSTITIEIPDAIRTWLEKQVETGHYESVDHYIEELLYEDKERLREPQLTLEELNILLAKGQASGKSDKTLKQIYEKAKDMIKNGEFH
jgi:antitoxin ParD1/3/4